MHHLQMESTKNLNFLQIDAIAEQHLVDPTSKYKCARGHFLVRVLTQHPDTAHYTNHIL